MTPRPTATWQSWQPQFCEHGIDGYRLDLLGLSALSRPIPGQIAEITSVLPVKAQQQVLAEFDRLAEEVAFKINAIDCSLV